MADEGGSAGLKKIARLSPGDKSRTARHSAVMNELIDRVNALSNAKIVRSGSGKGKVLASDSNVVFDLGKVGGGDLPATTGMDNSKKYALVAIHDSSTGNPNVDLGDGWGAEWVEVCSS